MKYYGTMICADTVEADRVLRKNGIDVEYIDITANMANMKEFLSLRDSREEFNEAKEHGRAGIPVFLKDDGSLEFNVYNLEGVIKEDKKDNSEMCSF